MSISTFLKSLLCILLLWTCSAWAQEAMWSPGQDLAVIRIYRESGDSASCQRRVLQSLQALPDKLKSEVFNDGGVRIVIVPTILDYRPELSGKTPRGYIASHDYSHVDAQYVNRTKEMLVAERVVRGSTPELSKRTATETLHEFGHALDYKRGLNSASAEFRAAYDADRAQLNSQKVALYHYFLQPGSAGRKELYAELFAAHYHDRAHLRPRYPQLRADFANSYRYLQGVLSAYQ